MHPSPSRFYVGIDPSLRSTGLSLLGPKQILAYCVRPKSMNGAQRLVFHRNMLRALLEECTYACIEGPSLGSTNRADDLGQLRGVLLVELADKNIPCLVIPPTTLKKFGAGSGAASKQLMIESAQELSGLENLNDDEADAFWLAYLAFALNEKPTGLKRHQLEVLFSLKNKKIKNKVSNPSPFNI